MSDTKHENGTGGKQTSDNFTEYKRLRNKKEDLIKKRLRKTLSKVKLQKTKVDLKVMENVKNNLGFQPR